MNWDYIAGFIDGEGSIIIKPPRVRIYISNTNSEVLKKIHEFVGEGFFYENKRILKPNWKKQYGWGVHDHKKVLKILKKLRKKIYIKRDKCEEAIKYIESKRWQGNYLSKEELKKYKHLPYRKIAKILGVSHMAVFKYLRIHELK